jgi:hypothetical protein
LPAPLECIVRHSATGDKPTRTRCSFTVLTVRHTTFVSPLAQPCHYPHRRRPRGRVPWLKRCALLSLTSPLPSTVSFHSRAPPSETLPCCRPRPAHRLPSLVTKTSRTTSPATTSAARRTSEATLPSQAPRRATIPLLARLRPHSPRHACAHGRHDAPRRPHTPAPSTSALLATHSSTPINTTLTTHDLPRARHPPLPFPILLALPYTYFVLFFHLYFIHCDRHVLPMLHFPSHLLPPRRRAPQPGTRRSRDTACS